MPRQVCDVRRYSAYSVVPKWPDATSRHVVLASGFATYSASVPGAARTPFDCATAAVVTTNSEIRRSERNRAGIGAHRKCGRQYPDYRPGFLVPLSSHTYI